MTPLNESYLCNLEEEHSKHINDPWSHQLQVTHLPILNGYNMRIAIITLCIDSLQKTNLTMT